MKYTKQEVMDLVGAESEEQFNETFAGKTKEQVLESLVYMFGRDGKDETLAEEIVIYANEN